MRLPALSPRRAALLAFTAALIILAIVLAMEHIGNLPPCPLCYDQRLPYYAAVPLLGVASFARPRLTLALLVMGGALFIYGFALAAYHVGVEWGVFMGPQSCSSARPDTSTDILRALEATQLTRCDIPAWSLFGISLAGYNALASLGLAALCFGGAARGFGSARRGN